MEDVSGTYKREISTFFYVYTKENLVILSFNGKIEATKKKNFNSKGRECP